jgi:cytochrome c-type biogenesis protein CcmH
MMVFWLVAALLLAAALIFILPPLFRTNRDDVHSGERAALNVSIYRDQLTEMERDVDNDVLGQEQYQQGRIEIEQRLLDDVGNGTDAPAAAAGGSAKITAIVLAILIPLGAVILYQLLGTPEGLDPEGFQPPAMSKQQQSDQINQMVSRLAARLQDDPNDAEGWKMLGRSYLVLERFGDARKAFEQAVKMIPNDAQLLADLADTIAMTSGQSLEGRPMELINKALRVDPQNEKALWLAGTAAYERKDYRQALGYWQRLYSMQQPGSEGARAMERNIAEIKSLLGEPVTMGMAPPPPPGGDSSAAATAGSISGELKLAANLQGQVRPSDSVFVFAQAISGPRMPLAVFRTTAAELPLSFTLDDTMSMTPQMRLSSFPEVSVTARISRSGSATAQSGDLQGHIDRVSTDQSQGLQLLIDEVVP